MELIFSKLPEEFQDKDIGAGETKRNKRKKKKKRAQKNINTDAMPSALTLSSLAALHRSLNNALQAHSFAEYEYGLMCKRARRLRSYIKQLRVGAPPAPPAPTSSSASLTLPSSSSLSQSTSDNNSYFSKLKSKLPRKELLQWHWQYSLRTWFWKGMGIITMILSALVLWDELTLAIPINLSIFGFIIEVTFLFFANLLTDSTRLTCLVTI